MGKAADMVRKYVELYNDGTPEFYGSDRFTELFAPDIDWQESPSSFSPSGRSGNRETVCEAVATGGPLMRDRKFEIKEIVEEGNTAAWTGNWSMTVGSMACRICLKGAG